MKKSLFLFATAALVLASCSNDVTVSENTVPAGSNAQKEIAFSTLAHTPKRAQGSIITTTFPTDNTMEVKAYQSAPSAAAYFDKTTFSKGTLYWEGSPKQYWPLSAATINFFAVSGYGLNANHITIADALASAGVAYTTANSYSATTQSDIMYAFNRGAVTQSSNALTFPDKVGMAFKHALALVDFEVKGYSATEVGAITVNSITLKGATYNGTLTLTNTNAATQSDAVTTTVSWAAGDEVASQAVPGISSATAITADYARIGTGLMVIPGTGFDSFVINYSLNGNSYNYEYTPDPAITTTVANNKYTFRITFKLHEILIDPSVTEWTNTNKDVTIVE